jgi:hypothetical protein
MRSLRLVVCLATLLTARTFGQTNSQKDVEGWSKAKWGMTDEQVLEAFTGDVVRLPASKELDPYAAIRIPIMKIGRSQFTVRFMLDPKTNQLCEVNILPVEQVHDYSGPRTNAPPEVIFDELQELLTQRHGKPTSTGPTHSGTVTLDDNSAVWRFPSTKIQLSYTRTLRFGNRVSVNYTRNAKAEL